MPEYHISRNGAALGVFPDAELFRLLHTGQVLYTDLCWKEGMTEWRPVSDLIPPPNHMPPSAPTPYAPPLAGPVYPQRRQADDAGMRMLLPVGRSGWAIAAGYLALFSVLLFPAPLALICAFLGMREIKNSQVTDNPKYGMGRVIFGFIMGGLGTLGLLCWLFFVYFFRRL